MIFNNKEDIIQLTAEWKGERLPDGRPMVPQRVLRALKNMTLEEVWKPIFLKGYESQFEGRLQTLHDNGMKLVGRAVTCEFAPTRPDLEKVAREIGEKQGFKGNFNQWVIDNLYEDDVVVADMYDKIYKGTFVGGNLTKAIETRTKNGGAVIWGGVRDVEQMKERKNTQVYYRGIDPTPIREFVMTGYNTPTRIGKAICMPGDVVFGSNEGVLFVPAHLAEKTVDNAEKSHLKDDFGFERLKQGVYSATEIDANWSEEMWQDFLNWFKTSEIAANFQYLTWDEDIERSRKMREDPEGYLREMMMRRTNAVRSTI